MIHYFEARLEIIGINPFVFIPEEILTQIFKEAGKEKGHIPVCGTVNDKDYSQTLVKYNGAWRLYINTFMLKHSPKRIGEIINVSVKYDTASREINAPPAFEKALAVNNDAKIVFDSLPPSRRLEIVRYLAHLKSEVAMKRNIEKAISFLQGKARFAGREKP
jgi:hypothetical protein